MPDPAVMVVRKVLEAFGQGDIQAVISLMDKNVLWYVAESLPNSDKNPYKGPDAVIRDVFGRIGDDWEYFNFVDVELLGVENEKVLVTGRYEGKSKVTGKTINAQFADIWTLKDGKVIHFQNHVDTKQIADAMQK